jgi:hypothetical protein
MSKNLDEAREAYQAIVNDWKKYSKILNRDISNKDLLIGMRPSWNGKGECCLSSSSSLCYYEVNKEDINKGIDNIENKKEISLDVMYWRAKAEALFSLPSSKLQK